MNIYISDNNIYMNPYEIKRFTEYGLRYESIYIHPLDK